MEKDSAPLQTNVEQLKLMLEAASQTAQLLQHQLATAKSMLASTPLSLDTPLESSQAQVNKRDYSEWLLPDGKFYPKGAFLLEFFRLKVERQYTLDELNGLFETNKLYSKEVRGNKIVFKLASDISTNEKSRFHSEPILTKDKRKILITNQIGTNNFPELIQYLARHFAFPIKGRNLTRARWPKTANSPFVEPNVEFA